MTDLTHRPQTLARPSGFLDHRHALAVRHVGEGVLRYGLVFLLLLFGTMKFFRFEAEAIQPLVANSPLMSWMYRLFSVGTTSAVIGVVEICTGLAIAARRFSPRLAAVGGLVASGMFLTTLSFLVSTPGALAAGNPAGGVLIKDLILLGAALYTAGGSLLATRSSNRVA